MVLQQFTRNFSKTARNLKKIEANQLKSKPKGISSNLWLARQLSDPYVEKAKQQNYRCRSAFKLTEINEKHNLFKRGQIIIDCGASPGSWTQVAVQSVNANGQNGPQVGQVLSIDKQHIYPIEGAKIFGNMDFTRPESQQMLKDFLKDEQAHGVISDMAPSASGFRHLDNENMMDLCYSALRFALQISRVDAFLIVKLWQCGQAKQLELDMLKFYGMVKFVKPHASRSDSAEIFLLGKNFKGLKS